MKILKRLFSKKDDIAALRDKIKALENEVIDLKKCSRIHIGPYFSQTWEYAALDPRPQILVRDVVKLLLEKQGLELKQLPSDIVLDKLSKRGK